MDEKAKVKKKEHTLTEQLKHRALYAKPSKTWEEKIPCVGGKTKVMEFNRFPNGVVKSRLKAMYKTIKGKEAQIA